MREVAYTHESFLRKFTLVQFLSVNYENDWTDLLIKDYKYRCYFTIKRKMMVINGDFVRFNRQGDIEDILSNEYARAKYDLG